jgi:hypothetical protein
MDAQKSAPEVFAELDGEAPALVPPGTYELRFDHYDTAVMFGRAPKLVIWFTIISFGPYFDTVKLPRFYNVRRLIGRPSRNGRFKAGHKSDFVREYYRLFRPPGRLDRISMSPFQRHIILGTTRTVTQGADQREIPAGLQYSVIDELTGIKPT